MLKPRMRLAASLAAILLAAAASACSTVVRTSPAPQPTSASQGTTDISAPSSPTNAASNPSPTGSLCVTSRPSGGCGPYRTPDITGSNGYNTYVANNMWAAGNTATTQTLTAYRPGKWNVVAVAPAGNTAVLTYPDTQQLFNDWCGKDWGGCPKSTDTLVSGLSSLTSSFAESMPHNSGTIAEAAYDIWLSRAGSGRTNEIMIWVDNVNRGTGGAAQIGTATIGSQSFTVLQYGGSRGEIIFSLNSNEGAGTADILGVMKWLIAHGHEPVGVAISQVDFGWEICSTGGAAETFTVSKYSIRGCGAGQACTS